jgi:hypothetical protein
MQVHTLPTGHTMMPILIDYGKELLSSTAKWKTQPGKVLQNWNLEAQSPQFLALTSGDSQCFGLGHWRTPAHEISIKERSHKMANSRIQFLALIHSIV